MRRGGLTWPTWTRSCGARHGGDQNENGDVQQQEKGEQALTTTTTRIFAAQIALAPAHVAATDATFESVWAALDTHRHLLVIGATDAATGRAGGVPLDMFGRLRAWCPRVCLLNEADGSRMRPFKAPAEHEPAIPVETTVVIPVVGADVFGKTLDAEHVHRPELVSALSGAPLGKPVTPEIVSPAWPTRKADARTYRQAPGSWL
jgi:probable selenium-dependent hydroxylase accessory protein YqeC